jgi:hypothetical protein
VLFDSLKPECLLINDERNSPAVVRCEQN